MPKNGALSVEEKARAVLVRGGQAGNSLAGYDESELAELAAIYDECVAPEALLFGKLQEFRGRHRERLEALKATVDESTPRRLFRNAGRIKAALEQEATEQ